MDVTDGFTLIESVKKFRAEDISYNLKVLQNAIDKKCILHWFKDLEDGTKTLFIQHAVQCYVHIISSAKLARGFFKILMDLPKEYKEEIKKELETLFEMLTGDVRSGSVKKLCELLNVSALAKETCKKLIIPTSKLVAKIFDQFTHIVSGDKRLHDLETLQHTLKICIHCLQTCHDTIKLSLSKVDDTLQPSSSELKTSWHKIFCGLLSVLFQNGSQELLGLTGTAISMVLNVCPSVKESARAYMEIISMIFTEKDTLSIFHAAIKKPLTTLSSEDKDLCALMLVKGLLLTCPRELLVYCDENDQPLLLFIFPFILKPCKGPQINHYLAFQILVVWFQKFKVIGIEHFISQSHVLRNNEELKKNNIDENGLDNISDFFGSWDTKHLMSSTCPVLNSTLSTIWLNWESPVDGVSEYVTSVFDCLMTIWDQAVKDHFSDYTNLSSKLMERLLIMSWHTKTRYRPLSILLPYIDALKLLQENPELKEDLLKCMTINGLAAVASDVYNCFLTQMKIQSNSNVKDVLSTWSDVWMPTLLTGITSSDYLQRLKVCTYWIPHSLKTIQGSDIALLDTLERNMKDKNGNKIQNLLAWTTVCRYSRDILGITITEHHYDYVKEAMVCIDEDVRAEALYILCNTLKRASPVSYTEIQLLKSFITVNLKTYSTSFRQSIISAMKKIVIRIRDSCLSELRSQNSSSEIVTNGIDFIDWLFKTLLQNLYPGGTYQCRQTILDLLEAVFSLLVFQEQNCTKKGKAQEGSDILMKFANRSGKWTFFNHQSFLILLSCLEDGSDHIQTQCFRILVEFFPWHSSLQLSNNQKNNCKALDMLDDSETSLMTLLTHEKTVFSMINTALDLASSPKSYETHSGLLLMSLILKKFVKNVGLIFDYDSHCKVTGMNVYSDTNCADPCPFNAFLDMLIHFLQTSVSAAKKDPASQFKFHPIHGLTMYATHCLKEICSGVEGDVKTDTSDRKKYLHRMTDVNKEIINLMLDILSGGSNLDQCPSFAEMGVALESLISADDENQEEVTTLSPDFQLLLSWCWINLKESCTSLGQVTGAALKGDKSFLSSSDIADIGEVFVRVLTTCRHRGAIEGCRSGFSQFCQVLLSCKVEEYSSIPKSMLTTIIHSLMSNSLTASISRRSAGLPIIVEIVTIQAVRICNDKHFLKTTVDELYSIASQPLSSDHSQQRDLSQVHALNILKAVFCDANLACHLGPLLSKLTILIIENFDSPSWAIRNAATQLISTLVMRIFGQRNKSSGSMTLEEFNSLHPELVDYILLKLQTLSSTKNVINPCLYVLLTVLSNLVMSPSHLHNLECRKVLQSLLSSYLDNPVYSLRSLSAKAYMALYELDKVDEELTILLNNLIHTRQSLNSLHGHLLCVLHLVSSDALSKSMYQKALKFFCMNKDLWSPSSSCFLPSSQVALILQKLLEGSHVKPSRDTSVVLWSHLECLISVLCQPANVVQAGSASCMKEVFRTMTSLASQCQDLHASMTQFICSSITSAERDLRESVISTLYENPFQEYLEDPSIQQLLWQSLMTESSIPIFVQSCDILYHLHCKHGHLSGFSKDIALLSAKELCEKWSQIDSVQSSILMLEGIVFGTLESSDMLSRIGMIQQWCNRISALSRPSINENLRLSASRALRKGGGKVLGVYKQNPSHDDLGHIAVSIIKATVQLLEDSETNVRNEVAIFVSDLMDSPHIHSNLAFHILSKFVTQSLSWSVPILEYFLEELFVCGDLKSECQRAFSTEAQRLFEPEMESILLEMHAKKWWAFQTLKDLSVDKDPKMLMQLKIKSCEAAKELQGNESKLTLDLKEKLFFNVSNKPKVMASLLGIVLLDALCQGFDVESDLRAIVERLLQMPYLHPLLKVKDVCTGVQSCRINQDMIFPLPSESQE